MSRYFFWREDTDKPHTCYWRKHPMKNFFNVYLDDQFAGQVFSAGYSGWGAIVTTTSKSRGPSLKGFKNRFLATQYMLWAQGITGEDDKP